MCKRVKFPLPKNDRGLVVMERKEDRECYEIPKGRYIDGSDKSGEGRGGFVGLQKKSKCVISFGDELEMKHSIKKDKLDGFLEYIKSVLRNITYTRKGFVDELSKYIGGIEVEGREVNITLDGELKYSLIVDDENYRKALTGFGVSKNMVDLHFEMCA